jgi:hypothetical protein
LVSEDFVEALGVSEDFVEVFVVALEDFVEALGGAEDFAEDFAIITAVASADVDPGVSSNKET